MSVLNQIIIQFVDLYTCPPAITNKAEYLDLTCRFHLSLRNLEFFPDHIVTPSMLYLKTAPDPYFFECSFVEELPDLVH